VALLVGEIVGRRQTEALRQARRELFKQVNQPNAKAINCMLTYARPQPRSMVKWKFN